MRTDNDSLTQWGRKEVGDDDDKWGRAERGERDGWWAAREWVENGNGLGEKEKGNGLKMGFSPKHKSEFLRLLEFQKLEEIKRTFRK